MEEISIIVLSDSIHRADKYTGSNRDVMDGNLDEPPLDITVVSDLKREKCK